MELFPKRTSRSSYVAESHANVEGVKKVFVRNETKGRRESFAALPVEGVNHGSREVLMSNANGPWGPRRQPRVPWRMSPEEMNPDSGHHLLNTLEAFGINILMAIIYALFVTPGVILTGGIFAGIWIPFSGFFLGWIMSRAMSILMTKSLAMRVIGLYTLANAALVGVLSTLIFPFALVTLSFSALFPILCYLAGVLVGHIVRFRP